MQQPSAYCFSKKEKLKSDAAIKSLFKQGSSIFVYPYKVYFQPVTEVQALAAASPVAADSVQQFFELSFPEVLVSVPKRIFKRAVDRNRVRRQMKEAYRLQKHLLLKANQQNYIEAIAFICVAKEAPNYALLHKQMAKVLERLATVAESSAKAI
jgi:ribonuclease P protein component